MRPRLWTLLTLLAATAAGRADVVTRPVEYRDGSTALEGCLAYDAATSGKRPGLLLAFEGAGNGPAARQRAGAWAKHGYVVFVMDLFGKDVTPRDDREAAARISLTGSS